MNIQWKKLLVAAVLMAVSAMNSASAADKGRGARLGGSDFGAQQKVNPSVSSPGNFGNARSGKSAGQTLSPPSNTLGNGSGGTSKGRTKTLPFQSIGQKPPILTGTPIVANPTPFKPIKPPILNPLPTPLPPIKPLPPFKPPVGNPGGPLNPFPNPLPPIKPLPPINPNPFPPTPPINPNPPGGGNGGGHGNGHGHGHGCHWPHHWNHWVGCINVYFPCPRVIQPCPLPCVGDTVIVTPVVTETVVSGSVTRIGIDLAVREVKVLSRGDATNGALYRVMIVNNGTMDLTGTARIALFAVGDAQPDASTPQVPGEFNGLRAGEIAIVDVRMPVAGNALPNLLVAVEVPEGVQDLNEANNVAIGEVAKLPM